MMQSVKRKWRHLLLLVAVFLIPTGFGVVWAESATVMVSGIFDQTQARKMLTMINDFRTGQYSWELDEDYADHPSDVTSWSVRPGSGQTWQRTENNGVEIISGLGQLKYDYTLEKVAMLRAIETAVYWDHNRPDSADDDCFTAYPDGYLAKGENIACGYNSFKTASAVMQAWMETADSYLYQGHRRNMLGKHYTAVGIAHVTHNGWEFWVQEFGYPLLNGTPTAAQNGLGSAAVTFSTDRVTPAGLSAQDGSETITVGIGEAVSIPETRIRLKDVDAQIGSSYFALGKADLSWTISDPSVAALTGSGAGSTITGRKAGTTELSTLFAGETLSYTVIVEKIDLSKRKATVSGPKAAVYTGKEVEPDITVKLDGAVLTEGTDYTLTWSKNIETGKAKVTVTGTGNYQGSVTKTFQIRLAEGFTFKDKKSGGVYRVTAVTSAAKASVAFVKPISAKKTSITIPASLKLSKTTCTVTAIEANAFRSNKKIRKVIIGKNIASIGKNAFRGASKLERVQIKTKKLTSGKVGASAFKGIHKKAVFKLPSAKKNTYRKILLKKGAKSTMIFG